MVVEQRLVLKEKKITSGEFTRSDFLLGLVPLCVCWLTFKTPSFYNVVY